MSKVKDQTNLVPGVAEEKELGSAKNWDEVNAILKRRVERGAFVIRAMTEDEFDQLSGEEQLIALTENRVELLSPEARKRLL